MDGLDADDLHRLLDLAGLEQDDLLNVARAEPDGADVIVDGEVARGNREGPPGGWVVNGTHRPLQNRNPLA